MTVFVQEIKALHGFYAPWWKTLVFFLVALVTGGFSLLVCKWSAKLYILLRLAPCSLKYATFVRVTVSECGPTP